MALSGVAGRGLLAFIFLAAPCCFAEDYVSPLAETLDEAKTRRNLFTHIRKDQAHESHQRPTALIVETPEKLEDLQQNVEKVRSKRGAIPGKAIPHEIVLNDHNPTMAVTWSGVSGNGSHSDVIVALTYSRNSAWLRSRASSHLYVSRDYGKTFPRIELDTPTGIVAKATLVLLCPESAGWGVILDTLNSLMWTTKDDFKTLALQPKVPFYLKQLSCHPNVPSVFLAVSTQQQLYVSKTFTNSWFSATTDPVTRFAWGSNQSYEHQYTIYAELSKGGIIRTDDFFKTRTVISKTGFDMKVQERHVIYLEKDPKQKYNTLMVSYLGKPAVAATFPEYANGTKFVPNEYFIAEILADSIMLAVNHYINLTNLYVSEDGNARFSFSLERILYHNPLSNYVNKYIKKVRADSFVDWHVVDGFPSVIISQQLGFGTVGHRKLHTVMTYDQGGYWSLVKAPALLNNSPTNCHLPNCSLHMVSEFIASLSQYPKIYSVESAPGLIMASAYYGKHYTGKQHVVMTRDNGVHWEFPKLPSSPSPYYDIRAGDHGGIIVAVPYSNIAVNSFYYSVDMGLTWSMFIFGTKQMVVSNIFSEPGETSSVFTLFGRFTGTYLQWAMVTVDLKAKLVRTCEPKDYFDWQPKPAFWDGEDPEGAQCLFGLREFITLRKPKSICYNGMKFERPHNVTSCSCERSDYECDVGYILSGWECLPNNDLVVIQGMKRALNCVAGKNISISKGYRRISGSFCAGGLTSLFEPAVFPCTHTTINKTVEVAFSLKIFRRTSTNGVVGVVTNATIPNSNGTVALSADTLPANASSSIRWQFGDGASTESQPGGTVHHKYSKPGIYTVVASASSRATSHVATVTVHTHELLTGKVPIDVQSYLGSSPLQKNTVILFTANIPQNINPALNYTWQFTYQGDSEKDSATLNTQQSPMVKHSFSTAGRYFVKVEVSGPVNKIHGGQWIYVNDLSPKVSIYPSSTTALVIGWKLPGPPTSARIIVKRVGSPDSEKPLQITTPNDIGSWVATGLVPGADYDVTVATVGERGCGGASAASASVVRLPVTDDSLHVKLSVPGPRTVRVTWRKAVGHTASTTYRVQLETNSWTTSRLVKGNTSAVFVGIGPVARDYAFFSVVVVKSDTDSSVEGGKHQPTELPRFVQSALQSPTGDYLHPPQHLELIAINHTTAVLIWQYDVPGVKLFTVTVTQGGNSITQQTSNKFFYAKNLIADTKVHIAVRPTCTSQVSIGAACPLSIHASLVKVYRYPEQGTVVRDVVVRPLSATTASVSWTYPNEIQQSVSGFKVYLSTPQTKNLFDVDSVHFSERCSLFVFQPLKCALVHLEAGKFYAVRVAMMHSVSANHSSVSVAMSQATFFSIPVHLKTQGLVSDGMITVSPVSDVTSMKTLVRWNWLDDTKVVVTPVERLQGSVASEVSITRASSSPTEQSFELLLFPYTTYTITATSSTRRHTLEYQTPPVLGIAHVGVFLNARCTPTTCDTQSSTDDQTFTKAALTWIQNAANAAIVANVGATPEASVPSRPIVAGAAFIGNNYYVVFNSQQKDHLNAILNQLKTHYSHLGHDVYFQDLGAMQWTDLLRNEEARATPQPTVQPTASPVDAHSATLNSYTRLTGIIAGVLAVALMAVSILYCQLLSRHRTARGVGGVLYHTSLSPIDEDDDRQADLFNDDLSTTPHGDDEPLIVA